MPKPASVPTWATDASYDDPGEDWDTEPTKVDPGAGKRATGWLPTEVLPADLHNHEMNLLGQWAGWLDDLFDAEGNHSFDGTQLRSIVFSPRSNLFEGEWDYEFDTGATDGLAFFSDINGARFGFWLENVIPNGALVQTVAALVRPGEARAGSNRMQLAWYEQTEGYGTPAVSLSGPNDSAFDDAGDTLQLLIIPGINVDVETDTTGVGATLAGTRRLIMLFAGNTGAAQPDALFSFVIIFNDAPGLTNR